VLNIVADYLRQDGIHFSELTGNTKISSRTDIVKKFNSPKDQNKASFRDK
jgi:SNF2 family DNA or RNA helicase